MGEHGYPSDRVNRGWKPLPQSKLLKLTPLYNLLGPEGICCPPFLEKGSQRRFQLRPEDTLRQPATGVNLEPHPPSVARKTNEGTSNPDPSTSEP